jgi:small GTP-binding protein
MKQTDIMSKIEQSHDEIEMKRSRLYTMRYNMGIIGDHSIGKTTLLEYYMTGSFNMYQTTIGVKHEFHHYDLPDGSEIILNIRDTAGQERFRAMTQSFVRDLHCVVVTYEICDGMHNKSVDDILDYWITFLKKSITSAQKEYLQLWIVATKYDLIEQNENVTKLVQYNINTMKKIAIAIKDNLDITIPESRLLFTSAKTGQNVSYLFDTVVKELYDERAKNCPIKRNKKYPHRSFILDDEIPIQETPNEKKKAKTETTSTSSSQNSITDNTDKNETEKTSPVTPSITKQASQQFSRKNVSETPPTIRVADQSTSPNKEDSAKQSGWFSSWCVLL